MKEARSLGLHAGLLVIAAGAAGYTLTRERAEAPPLPSEVTLWTGRAADVRRIAWESKTRKVVLASKTDAVGRYFVATVERETPSDGGAPNKTTSTFASVAATEKVAEALAQLRATRSIGKLDAARSAEFGLASPEGTIALEVGPVTHKLVVGGSAPGASDRYVLDTERGEAFAIKADPVRDLETAETRLVERDLHAWKEADITTAKISAGARTRDVVRGGEGTKRFWADPAAKDKPDETLANWLSKVDRVRITDYQGELPAGASKVVRIEYAGAAGALGYLELAKAKGESGKDEWFLSTERTRLWGKASPSLAEQVAQDLDSVAR